MRWISWLVENRLASQEGLCSKESDKLEKGGRILWTSPQNTYTHSPTLNPFFFNLSLLKHVAKNPIVRYKNTGRGMCPPCPPQATPTATTARQITRSDSCWRNCHADWNIAALNFHTYHILTYLLIFERHWNYMVMNRYSGLCHLKVTVGMRQKGRNNKCIQNLVWKLLRTRCSGRR